MHASRLKAALEHWLVRVWYGETSWRDRMLAALLAPLAVPASALVASVARQRRRKTQRQSDGAVPAVVVVGNLVAGGAGKTPTVIALAAALTAQGHRVGLLARGYRRDHRRGQQFGAQLIDPRPGGHANGSTAHRPAIDVAALGDEAALLAHQTGLPIAVAADRAAALAQLSDRYRDLTVVISDDGLQHPGLARALELVVVDERGFGNGRCLPAGPLREPIDRLSEVDAVILHRRSQLPPAAPPVVRSFSLETALSGFRALHQSGRHWSPDAFTAAVAADPRALVAVAAIARPERFFADLRALGLVFTAHPLADHARIDADWLDHFGASRVIMTEKDAVKLEHASTSRPSRHAGTRAAPLDEVPLRIVAEQSGRLDPALLHWLQERLPRVRSTGGTSSSTPPQP